MVGQALRALWTEPRPAQRPPVRVWRDWALLGLLAGVSLVELALRDDRAWWLLVLAVSAVIAGSLLWRRTRPLAAVAAAFGALIAFDSARILAIDATGLMSIAGSLVLPYALLRWGSGREGALGLGLVLGWLAVTLVAESAATAEVIAGYGFFLFSAALGASIRFHVTARARGVEQAKLEQRNELARELHDTVGHHVSAIAIQAQAGRSVAAADPERAAKVLATIEEAASRTLTEMRAMVGLLRDGAEPDIAPQPGVGDIQRLTRDVGGWPRVHAQVSGELGELTPAVGLAIFRIAQESVTNALRHAQDATRVTIRVTGEDDQVRLTVCDDGDGAAATPAVGYGITGMTERASVLGGVLRAGPGEGGGWIVEAVLPKRGASWPHAATN